VNIVGKGPTVTEGKIDKVDRSQKISDGKKSVPVGELDRLYSGIPGRGGGCGGQGAPSGVSGDRHNLSWGDGELSEGAVSHEGKGKGFVRNVDGQNPSRLAGFFNVPDIEESAGVVGQGMGTDHGIQGREGAKAHEVGSPSGNPENHSRFEGSGGRLSRRPREGHGMGGQIDHVDVAILVGGEDPSFRRNDRGGVHGGGNRGDGISSRAKVVFLAPAGDEKDLSRADADDAGRRSLPDGNLMRSWRVVEIEDVPGLPHHVNPFGIGGESDGADSCPKGIDGDRRGGDSSSPGDHGDLSGIERKGGDHPQELAKGWRSLEEL